MGLTGTLKQISTQKCGHCNKPYGDTKDGKGHSKKQFLRCLYTANYNLFEAIEEIDRLKNQKEIFEKITVDEEGQVVVDGEKTGDLKEDKIEQKN